MHEYDMNVRPILLRMDWMAWVAAASPAAHAHKPERRVHKLAVLEKAAAGH